MPDPFDIDSAISLYQTDRWGADYFVISKSGHMCVHPLQSGEGIAIAEVVEEARERGLPFPLVIRFQDLLRHRVVTINEAFSAAIEELHYGSLYRGVFPIKVNQLREVVEEIIDAGAPYHFGIEAGSKPELLAAMAVHTDSESLLICNGSKDVTFIRQALLGRKLGKKVIVVIEKMDELARTLRLSKEMGVEPLLGLRVRLQSKGAGKWATSGGENAKFGLSTAELVEASRVLKDAGLAQCLKLVHFHVGSQVPDIGTIKSAVREAARFYSKLVQMGHPLGYLDVGGGLGVDYLGSRSTSDSSMNYTLPEYARDVVYNIIEVCDSENVAHPVIVSESGRALVAHHSVLVVEAFGTIEKCPAPVKMEGVAEDAPLVQSVLELHASLSTEKRRENLHDAIQYKEQAQNMFELGLLDLESKARIETLYWDICRRTVDSFDGDEFVPDEIRELEVTMADQFLCNFSVFQSLLDHWALGQLFPVMPISRLNEEPTRNAVLVDITCDSDGKVSEFIGLEESHPMIKLHNPVPGEPYYIGFFMVGAYQDIMGDFHNLFGRATEVHVFLDEDEDSGYYIEEVIHGTSIKTVLDMTQWDQRMITRMFKKQVDDAIRSNRLKPKEAMKLLSEFETGLSGFSYLDLG